MIVISIISAGLETVLNRVLYRDRGLKAARQRLNGRSLTLMLTELRAPLTLLFSEKQLDVVSQWQEAADCTVQTRIATLIKLRDRQLLTPLIRSGELNVKGDLQVVQQFSALLDMAEHDPAEYLAPWLGDVAAHGLSRGLHRGLSFLRQDIQRKRRYLSEAITEEWRLAPGALESAWLADEIIELAQAAEHLDARLRALETK